MTPLVTVIVTHHLDENRDYLALCLEALKRQKDVSFEVLVIADTEEVPFVPEDVRFKLVHDRNLNNATKKVHYGIAMSHPETKYYLLLSDDVVISENTLNILSDSIGDQAMLCTPMSNSDNGSQFYAPLPWPCNLDIQDEPDPLHRVNDQEIIGMYLMVPKPWFSFYCAFIPRKVWEAVGPLDERLENRHNDTDYCLRAAQKGILSWIHFGCFALHYGSKTLNKVAPEEVRNEASRVFMAKWPGAV